MEVRAGAQPPRRFGRPSGHVGRRGNVPRRGQRGRRRARHERRPRRHGPAPVRHGRRPLRHRPPRGTVGPDRGHGVECQRASGFGSRSRSDARRRPDGDAVQARHPIGHGAGVRRRLDGAPRALREHPDRATPRSGAGAGGRWVSGQPVARRLARPARSAVARTARRTRRAGHAGRGPRAASRPRTGTRRPGARRPRLVLPGRVRRGADGARRRSLRRRRPRHVAGDMGATAHDERVRCRPPHDRPQLPGLSDARRLPPRRPPRPPRRPG